MSKTTPEEAIALVRKHQIDGIWTAPRILGLAALIDEVRGVDAEPVAHQFQDRDGNWHPFIDYMHYKNTSEEGSWPIRALYTHPAPSQPAGQSEPTVIYSPIETSPHASKDGRHPNDKELLDSDYMPYLHERGDNEGQGLCEYWKWGYRAGWNDRKRFVASPTHEPAAQAPEGFALVPLRMTHAMQDVVAEESWQWEELLAAAEAITEDQYTEIAAPAPSPAASINRPLNDVQIDMVRRYGASKTNDEIRSMLEETVRPAAPVELPVVMYWVDGSPLVKLADAQADIAAAQKGAA